MLDPIPMKHSDLDMKAKTPDGSMLLIEPSNILRETKQTQIPQDLRAQ